MDKNENESVQIIKKRGWCFYSWYKTSLRNSCNAKCRGGQEVLKDQVKEFKEKIQILNGRYGVYLKCGKTNVSIPKIDLEKFSIDDAVFLLEKLKDKKELIQKNKKVIKKLLRKRKLKIDF